MSLWLSAPPLPPLAPPPLPLSAGPPSAVASEERGGHVRNLCFYNFISNFTLNTETKHIQAYLFSLFKACDLRNTCCRCKESVYTHKHTHKQTMASLSNATSQLQLHKAFIDYPAFPENGQQGRSCRVVSLSLPPLENSSSSIGHVTDQLTSR